MISYLFVGPFPPPLAGPTVKNSILFEELSKHLTIKKIDTNNWKKNILKSLRSILFAKEDKLILSVSKNGRLLLPILRLKKMFKKRFSYYLLPMGDGLNKELVESNWIIRKLLMFGLKSSKSIFIQTYTQYNELKVKYPFLSITYFPSFKKKPKIDFSYNLESDTFRVVYVSTVKPEKGILTLVKAVENLKAIDLDIYGPIEVDFKKSFLESIEGKKNIHYRGVLKPNEVSETINKYQLFVFPTHWKTEGFSNVLIDAMIASVPIIASDWNYNGEIISDGKNGRLFEPNNSIDLKNKILDIKKNKSERFKYSLNNKEKAKSYYIEDLVSEFLDVIRL